MKQGVSKISRTAIKYDRVPVIQCEDYESCSLCKGFVDCMGRNYVSPEYSKPFNGYRLMCVNQGFSDWESLEQTIWSLDDQGVLLRIITEVDLPQKVLWAISYSAHNILQINVDMTKIDQSVEWISKLMAWSNNCGVYVVLFIYPIIPTVIKTYQVIDLMDRYRNYGYHHFTLKFVELIGCKKLGDNVIYYGHKVPVEYLQKAGKNNWKCSPTYIEKFMSTLNYFVIPRKVSVSICGISDCTGLGG